MNNDFTNEEVLECIELEDRIKWLKKELEQAY
jgi:hypothetical protein